MKSYLKRIAQVFAENVGEHLSGYTFVFPNHRAGLFFRKYLGQSLDHPIFSPEIMTINDCFGSLSELYVADQLSLLVRLYDLYKNMRPSAEPIEKFLHWGKMMLADFSEIDNHLVSNVEALYEAVEDIHDIDTHFLSLTSEQRKAIERFWGEFYGSKNHNNSGMHNTFLSTWQLLYPLYVGLRDSLLQEKLAYEGLLHRHVIENWGSIPAERFKKHYVFIGFNALTESERQLMLRLRDRGCADFYFDYESTYLSDEGNRASLFKDDNIKLFKSRYSIPKTEFVPPKITHVSVSSTVAEAREVYRILQQLYPENLPQKFDYTKTAVVLPDEQLLIPLLDCFPQSITDINVTMGYPLRASDLYLLVDSPEKAIENLPSEGLPMLLLLREQLKALKTKENSEVLYLLCKTISHIEKVIAQYPNLSFSADAVMQILRMLTKDMTIPYVGEPLNGLQVMGVLETRALDFDNIIITCFNDELYPGRSHGNSFIPYILRRGFGLPTPERQNAIFAYNFYRMISYAQHVWFITNATADDRHSGEVSRYLYQLRWQYQCEIEYINVVQALAKLSTKQPDQPKTEAVLMRLEQMKKRRFSASMLNKYLYCQKQFYYRYVLGLKEPKQDDDVIVPDNLLGTVTHKIMEILYQPYENRLVEPSDLRSILDSLTEEVWQSLPLSEIVEDPLAVHVVRNYVRNILEYDWQLAPFYYYAGETKVNAELDVPDLGVIKFEGIIDRVDEHKGVVRVIDYKTGAAPLEYSDMNHVFNREKNQDKALQTLLYCWMFKEMSPDYLAEHVDVVPHIYAVRTLAKGKDAETRLRPKNKSDFSYTTEVEQELKEALINLLREIYNPELAFVPTSEQTRCDTCLFYELCKG